MSISYSRVGWIVYHEADLRERQSETENHNSGQYSHGYSCEITQMCELKHILSRLYIKPYFKKRDILSSTDEILDGLWEQQGHEPKLPSSNT